MGLLSIRTLPGRLSPAGSSSTPGLPTISPVALRHYLMRRALFGVILFIILNLMVLTEQAANPTAASQPADPSQKMQVIIEASGDGSH